MADPYLIACAVQSGLIIGTDAFTNNPIKLAGPGANYGRNEAWGLTSIDPAVWNAFSGIYANNPLITSGAVWRVS
jgi:hypothetical protein